MKKSELSTKELINAQCYTLHHRTKKKLPCEVCPFKYDTGCDTNCKDRCGKLFPKWYNEVEQWWNNRPSGCPCNTLPKWYVKKVFREKVFGE